MALTFKAAQALHWFGTDYNAGDTIVTTGWPLASIRMLLTQAPVYVQDASSVPTTLTFFRAGALTVLAGAFRIYNDTPDPRTISAVRTSVGTAPTGAAVLVDVNKNGTTIFTTQGNRPSIAIAGNTSGKVTNMNITALAAGDYVSVDVDQIGSGTAGSDLVVQVVLL